MGENLQAMMRIDEGHNGDVVAHLTDCRCPAAVIRARLIGRATLPARSHGFLCSRVVIREDKGDKCSLLSISTGGDEAASFGEYFSPPEPPELLEPIPLRTWSCGYSCQ
jgi:hypothetical protein